MRFVGNPTPWTPEQKKAYREHCIRLNSHALVDGYCRCGFVNDGAREVPRCPINGGERRDG